MSLYELNSIEILGTSIKSQEDFLSDFENRESEDSWSNSIVIDDDEPDSTRNSEMFNSETFELSKPNESEESSNEYESETTSDSETYEKLGKLGQLIPSPLSKSNYNLARIESFGAKLPNDLSKEKKMSLLIVVLLQMVFINNKDKLTKLYKYLHKKNILDLEVTKNSYSEMRRNVSFIIESLNNFDSNELPSPDYRIENKTKYINKYRNNFNQISLLGKGGYGSVYKVFHLFEKKYYAIKKIFIVQDLISEDYDIFNEIQLYSGLIHPNVVRYYSSWVDIDLTSIIEFNKTLDISEDEPINKLCPILFIQMELCDMTLREYFLTQMEEDCLTTRMQYFKQILAGIEYLHSNNLMHRDLKPDNIFIKKTEAGFVFKIGDFGLTKNNSSNKLKNIKEQEYKELNKLLENIVTDDNLTYLNSRKNSQSNILMAGNETKLLTIDENSAIEDEIEQILSLTTEVGTGMYRAKEIVGGSYDKSIDIYSLGVILIEFLLSFNTNHEKVSKITEIFNLIESGCEKIPYLVTNEFDSLIILMINSNPILRPKINDLINIFSKI